jgi:cyclophilin family peptidyl-prolyl cis-trans isomerase/HEAT repeat protein
MKKMLSKTILASAFLVASLSTVNPQRPRARVATTAIPVNILLKIIRAEDERRWDENLRAMLADKDPKVRKRAALAAGRIGNEGAVPALAEMLLTDRDTDVRQMAAFALGEIESPGGAYALTEVLKRQVSDTVDSSVRARTVEALGKIVAKMIGGAGAPADAAAAKGPEDDRLDIMRAAIVDALRFEDGRRSQSDRLTILLGLTAVLRIKPDGVGKLIARFLDYSDPRIVADALNTMARLRLKDGNDQARALLVKHDDPIVRANAARVLSATEDKQAFEGLLDRALHDSDLRVRVSAIRALGSLKEKRAAEPLVRRGNSLLNSDRAFQSARNELLEITSTLGRLLPNTLDEGAVNFVRKMHEFTKGEAVEVEIALARIVPGIFQDDPYRSEVSRPGASWRQMSTRAQSLAAIKDAIVGAATGSAGDTALKDARLELAVMLRRATTPRLAVPEILQAYANFKSTDATEAALSRLADQDVIVRSTAAEVLGTQSPSNTITVALISALRSELPRNEKGEINDAALAILGALANQKSAAANDAIKTALDSSDHLIRRRAVALLEANGVGDFSNRIGTVKTRNTVVDYRRAVARIGKKVTATVVTTRGAFTIEFIPQDAPLTVDNFIKLARKGFFNGQTIPRVVPNFVIQAGDPRGDTNGGPGYQIRCEINEVPYERAAVGMALSGKDTGGSQWFVTHSPQPHLDGGYTVFGHVTRGMEVIDNIARGDIIRRVVVDER